MMGKQDGLCPLQMGVAGHDDILICLCLPDNGGNDGFGQRHDLAHFVAQVKTHIQRHLIVAAACRVQFFAHITQSGGQLLLHEHMNVLAGEINGQRARFQIVQNRLQTGDQRVGLGGGDDMPGTQHGGVRHTAGNILLIQTPVKPNGGVKVVCHLIHMAGSPPGPHFCHDCSVLC